MAAKKASKDKKLKDPEPPFGDISESDFLEEEKAILEEVVDEGELSEGGMEMYFEEGLQIAEDGIGEFAGDVTPATQNTIKQSIENWDQHNVADSERYDRLPEIYAGIEARQMYNRVDKYNKPVLTGEKLESLGIYTAKLSKTFVQHWP